jgi:predicted dehydrogenase
MHKVRWGIISTAKIGREKVIPAMQQSAYCHVIAIASRNKEEAQNVARNLNIPKAYGSYEELLDDAEVDAVYIPLPNHMHVPWAIKAIEKGKHVLCEKPIALSAGEAQTLLNAAQQKPQLKIMEAFMYRFHPQWVKSKQLVSEGALGELKTIQSFFSYYNVDENNIRNIKEAGGGGLMDIGCYCISLSRFLYDSEPQRVSGIVDYNPKSGTDHMASGILDFGSGTATFTCSTQAAPYQRVNIIGAEGRIEIEIPFNAPPDVQTRIWLFSKGGKEEITFDAVDQYSLQGDLFSKAILDHSEVPTPLIDAVNNMKVIEAIFESAETNSWKEIS